MARYKKAVEEKKQSPEDRLMERWYQQIFFIKKQFPNCEKKIQAIQKNYLQKGTKAFVPTEEALFELTELYMSMKKSVPLPTATAALL